MWCRVGELELVSESIMCSAFAYFTNTAYAASMNARENLFKLAKKCNKKGKE